MAEHIKSDEKKLIKEKEPKEAQKSEAGADARKAGDPIKSKKDYNEAIVQHIRESDSSLRIEVSKLNDEDIDEQIEAHKESLRIADLRKKSAEDAAARIKAEDEEEKKKAEAALVEREKQARLNQDWTISTDKLEDLETGEEKLIAKKPEAKVEANSKSKPAEKKSDAKNAKTAAKHEAPKDQAKTKEEANKPAPKTEKKEEPKAKDAKSAIKLSETGKKPEAKPEATKPE